MRKLLLTLLFLGLLAGSGLLLVHSLNLKFWPRAKITTPGPLRVTLPQKLGVLTGAGIIGETNQHRALAHLAPLTHNTTLDSAAQKKADDILARQYFQHVAPDGTGPADLVTQAGYAYLRIGENLALGAFPDDITLVQAWMNSPGHRANILSTHFDEIGIGLSRGRFEGEEVWVAVQTFAQPASRCPAPSTQERQNIETKRVELEQLATTLEQTHRQLAALAETINRGEGSPQAINEFTEQQTAYNNQVSHYNALQAELHTQIDIVNTAIRRYNSCLNQ